MVKKIAVATGTRAEFGLLQPLLEKIVADPETELQLIVTGMHLSPEFGMTVNEIRDAGYEIADEIEILLSSDTGVGTAKSVGLATIGFADTLRRLTPDWLVVLGDRFEILAAATAAMLVGVPIAHIHGGERTEGLIDEPIRHSVTKMAMLHFVSTPEYRKRVIQLGEDPERVFHVGAIGLDRVRQDYFLSKRQVAYQLGIDSQKPWCTVTYHPVTLDPASVETSVNALIGAMRARQDLYFIITKANADENGRKVNSMLAENVDTAVTASLFVSLGSKRFVSQM
jgi:GDP/UDP-N,N'-diacetylbacillosamine 2-epimerase (hydrolysing)